MGDLVCHAVTCGATLDKKSIEESSFSPCTDGDEVGDTCATSCREGFYSDAGTGTAVFTCQDVFEGTWLENGDTWFHSSLVSHKSHIKAAGPCCSSDVTFPCWSQVCKRCPTIEHCAVSACATGTDAVCSQCEPG